jgi:DNA-binding GntR family transcriptional regulator
MTYGDHVELDHDSPTPLYVQLAALIRGQIENGELTGRIPSVKHFAQEYQVGVSTAEKAFAILRAEGLVISAQGRGHFTKPRG